MQPLQGSQLTDEMMVNPWMFDPSQLSNQFSLYNNQALPFPPTYNDTAGGPVNAATGQPIASYQQWKQQNPGGLTLNATPAQPQAPQAQPMGQQGALWANYLLGGGQGAAPSAGAPGAVGMYGASGRDPANMANLVNFLGGASSGVMQNTGAPGYGMGGGAGAGGAPPGAGGGGQGGSPNNWYAALNALSNPGTPAVGGATVPMAQGYQPAGGVNQAFLNQAGAGQGMNTNFLSALAAIQGRRQ
jgi:hypothetical protein